MTNITMFHPSEGPIYIVRGGHGIIQGVRDGVQRFDVTSLISRCKLPGELRLYYVSENDFRIH